MIARRWSARTKARPMFDSQSAPWEANWAWGLPLILFTVVVHVCGMGLIYERASRLADEVRRGWQAQAMFLVRLAFATLQAAALHGFEAAAWAWAYNYLGAIPSHRDAMLYSLNAITSYGHVAQYLPDGWQLLGALEALNGAMLFGLTTAFLFAIIGKIWPGRERRFPEPRDR